MALAEDYGAELHVLHVVQTPEMLTQFEAVLPVADATFVAEMEKNAREQIEKVVSDDLRRRLEVKTALRSGVAFLEIVRYAKDEGIDLIVIPTHGHTGLRHALFGSVAEKVIRKAPCAVLSIRPDGHDPEAV